MSNKKDAAAADQRYFMVLETGSVYTLTELEGLKAEGYGYDLAALCEVWPAVADPVDSDPSDWTEDPPADGSIAPRLAGLQNSQPTTHNSQGNKKNGIASDPMCRPVL